MSNIKDIENVFELFKEHGLTQFSYSDGDINIELKKETMQPMMAPVQPIHTQPVNNIQMSQIKQSQAPQKVENTVAISGNEIKSPIHGNLYRSPSPDAKAFIEVGQTISEGQVVCIIESMKLMNEIKSPFSGKVVDILIENGKAVGKGETIIIVE